MKACLNSSSAGPVMTGCVMESLSGRSGGSAERWPCPRPLPGPLEVHCRAAGCWRRSAVAPKLWPGPPPGSAAPPPAPVGPVTDRSSVFWKDSPWSPRKPGDENPALFTLNTTQRWHAWVWYSSQLLSLDQTCQTPGPRAKFGPTLHFIRSVRALKDNH